MDVDEPGQATEVQQLEGIRKRFLDALWNYSVVVDKETSQTTSVASNPGSENSQAIFPYRQQVAQMSASMYQDTLFVRLEDIKWVDADLADTIQLEWCRVEPHLRQAVQQLVRKIDPEFLKDQDQNDREFYIAWEGIDRIDRLRDLRSAKVGALLAWKGTVTRTTEVRPELYLATFKCKDCGERARNVEQQFVLTYPMMCPAAACGNKSHWQLIKEESKFVDWQRAKVQENSDEMPAGSLPRSLDVIIRGEMVEAVRPGDKVVFTGCLIVVPDMGAFSAPGEKTLLQSKGTSGNAAATGRGVTGVRATGARELHHKLAFLANNVQLHDQKQAMVDARTDPETTPEEVEASFPREVTAALQRMGKRPDIYHALARCVAPGVYGHEDVKKAVLLMLVGGVNKTTAEGIRLRGDINVAIVGDPSTAKSQVLKYVAEFLPRAVYTGGKSSSAAGLTATVVREADSGEHAIEAGALMLADNGICCIDEFDKMDVKDQVAIHEAMEQQTISIAKAGIQATLNARTAILAAANPLGGRYDRAKPLKYNVNLPPAILSRFDLLHVMVDEVNPAVDEAIAHHIIAAHQCGGRGAGPEFDTLTLQRYIRYARSIKPKLGAEARVRLVEAFKALRSGDAVPGSGSVYRITVRQLEALIRLSEALARLSLRTEVAASDVREAQRLIKASVHSAGDADIVMDLPDDDIEPEAMARLWLDDDDGAPAAAADGEAAVGSNDDADADANARRVRRRAAPAEEEAAAQPPLPAAAAPREQTRISRQKWAYLQNHVLGCLKQAEAGEMAEQAAEIRVAAQKFVGLSQHDIIKWHIRTELEKGALDGQAAVVAEIQLLQKVIHVMVAREGTLVEMQVPERRAGETRAEHVLRREKERVLVVNPNYYME